MLSMSTFRVSTVRVRLIARNIRWWAEDPKVRLEGGRYVPQEDELKSCSPARNLKNPGRPPSRPLPLPFTALNERSCRVNPQGIRSTPAPMVAPQIRPGMKEARQRRGVPSVSTAKRQRAGPSFAPLGLAAASRWTFRTSCISFSAGSPVLVNSRKNTMPPGGPSRRAS